MKITTAPVITCVRRHHVSITLFALALFFNAGCSVYMAAKQPEQKDVSVLKPGVHRSRVIAELEAPVWSGEKEGDKMDVFVFKQGYSGAARTARAVFHGTADVFSLGLWEVISTPTEAYFSGSDMKVEVSYDNKDLVKSTADLTGNYSELDHRAASSTEKTEAGPREAAGVTSGQSQAEPTAESELRPAH